MQLGFRTPNHDGNTTLCMASAVSGYKLSFGSDGPPGNYTDLETADVVLLIGANIADNHPILCNRLERNKNRTLVVVDPRVTKTAMMADIHLPVKPRSDIALINGIAHILIRDGLIDRGYITQHTTGFDDLNFFVMKFTPQYVAEVTGLSIAQIESSRLPLRSAAKAAFIGWTMGVNHFPPKGPRPSPRTQQPAALITGNIGRTGAAPFSITGQCNAMGTREAGFTSSLPGYRKFDNPDDRAALAALWDIDVRYIPTARGLAYPDIIEAAVMGKIKALWFIATNPAVSFPNYSVLEQALRSVEFLVVQDGFHPTPTSDFADLVLPAAIWGEKEGTYTNSERRVSKVNRIVAPPRRARADFDIFVDLAERMGVRNRSLPRLDHHPRRLPRVAARLRWPHVRLQRVHLGRGRAARRHSVGRRVPLPRQHLPHPRRPRQTAPCPVRTLRRTTQQRNTTSSSTPDVPSNTGTTRTKTAQVDMLNKMVPNAWLEMNPIDAKRLQLSSHDRVTVVSRRSKVANLELRITAIVAPGQVFMPFHFSETNSNLVTLGAFDPISREPNFKQCAVRIEKTAAT